jgi:hypothetical protein
VDLYDGSDGSPKIYHKSTLTSKLNFEDALIAIKQYAFKLTEYELNFKRVDVSQHLILILVHVFFS